MASWYRPPGSTSEEFQLLREHLDYIRTHHKGKKLPSVHVLEDFNFKDTDWPDRPCISCTLVVYVFNCFPFGFEGICGIRLHQFLIVAYLFT